MEQRRRMAAENPDRRAILAIAAAADCDPRTVQRRLRGRRVMPAIAHAIDHAIATLPEAAAALAHEPHIEVRS